MKRAVVIILILAGAILIFQFSRKEVGVPKAEVNSIFPYYFDSLGTLFEASEEKNSTSPYWWLDSGGVFLISGGVGQSNTRELEGDNYWRKLYAKNNPVDTDNGYHPQNILRLITRSEWENSEEEVYFYIQRYNLSESPNRNESNGILLLSRYKDSDNLYYAGLRVDGHSVIKKKVKGTYYILAENQYIPGLYNKQTNPNLLPTEEWIGLRMVTTTNADRSVHIELLVDRGTGFEKILEARDTNENAPAILGSAFAGIRTDFMDVSLENYQIREL